MTLFGDHWEPGRPPVPSSGLVRILEEFGITASNARAALSRMTRQGVLERHRQGRCTSYSIGDDAWRVLERGARRIFAEVDGGSWDGTWTLVAFSLPSRDGELRRLLRARLRWMTFWPLYDGSWVAPHDRREQVREQLGQLGITDAIVVRSQDVGLLRAAEVRLRAAWDLPGLARAYEEYLTRYRHLAERADRGEVEAAEALVRRTELVDDWRRIVRDDPDLPRQLLPQHLPRSEAREVFLRTYRALHEPAVQRFSELAFTGERPS